MLNGETEILALHATILATNYALESEVKAAASEVDRAVAGFCADSVQREAALSLAVVMQKLHSDLGRYQRVCGSVAEDFVSASKRAQGGGSYVANPLASVNVHDVPRLVGSIEATREALEIAADALVGALACPDTPHPIRVLKRRKEAERAHAAAEAERTKLEQARAARAAKRAR